jgi:hypothetical protein
MSDCQFIPCPKKLPLHEKRVFFGAFFPTTFLASVICENKSAIFAENMKTVGVCRFKKVRFLQPFGVKLKICKTKKKQ